MTKLSALALSAVLLCQVPLSAGDSFGVRLFRPDSLLGWDHGEAEPAGWTMTGGVLSGSAEATPLLSGFLFGEFELRWQWDLSEGGAWKLSLPEAPNGAGLTIMLREGDRCGQLADGDSQLDAGGKVERKAGDRHTAMLRRTGGKLELTVNERPLWTVDVDPRRRFGLGLALAAGEGTLADMRVREPAGKPIFNGTDLTGWWTPGDLSKWRVEDGQIVRTEQAGDYLRTEKDYGNYTVSFEYKMAEGANSGLGIRTPREGWPTRDGMELQMWDDPNLSMAGHMSICGNMPPAAIAYRSEQWNHLVVQAHGYMITAWENGELVQHDNTEHHPELRNRNLRGWLGFQDHGHWTRFRNVMVLEAPEGMGLDAWRRPPPKQAAQVVDRLMNPWLLAEDDGIVTGTVGGGLAVDDPTEHVLAELTGPGAVVRVAQIAPEGRMAFYFDGEDKPRIEADAAALLGPLPRMSAYANPVITCLTYRKSLRIVLRGARRAAYRIDYVTFPSDYRVTSFAGRGRELPRGWLDSVAYRHARGSFGDYRNTQVLPRPASEPTTVAPGTTVPVLELNGAGIVRYVRLRADQRWLADDSLWLEVTVDGEPGPAVSTPVRLWLAGLAGPKNYNNLVHFARDGFGSTQAMPFGNGISFSLKNTGSEPIRDISLEVCFEPAEGERGQEVAAMMRLRGVFQPAGEGGHSLARYEGAGRLVALASELPEGSDPGIGGLIVDGIPQDGWQAPNLDLLLGQPGEFQASLSGRAEGLAWRYFWLAPVEFQKSLALNASTEQLGGRLALFYVKGP
ncbi:MAG: DUF1080 domain-containing protein [Thermoguttaceae bacterium]|jgi:hypothetical protein|nr:DUF1080 domain-containing protein [Thermoguttaceae bacterium]